jgi:transcriptional repressor of cell division inhibition gene dicB
MKKSDAIQHFGSVKKLADALGLWPQTVYLWKDEVPDLIAYKLYVITGGKLELGENIVVLHTEKAKITP